MQVPSKPRIVSQDLPGEYVFDQIDRWFVFSCYGQMQLVLCSTNKPGLVSTFLGIVGIQCDQQLSIFLYIYIYINI